MADGGFPYPTVFTVDGRTGIPPLPPKPGQRRVQRQRRKVTEIMLFLLVIMALFGILVEACFIYNLQSKKQDKPIESHQGEPDTPQHEARKSKKKTDRPVKVQTTVVPKTPRPTFPKPSKPLAHVSGGTWPGKDGVMPWSEETGIFQNLKFTHGNLVVEKTGFYYIYSKVTFKADGGEFTHSVMRTTPLYRSPDPIELLRYNYVGGQKHNLTDSKRNSYLGGVFSLSKKDNVFVQVRQGRVVMQYAGDNFFGMFML